MFIDYAAHGDQDAGNKLHTIADRLTRKLTAFDGIEDLVSTYQRNGYRPTLRPSEGAETVALADLYDLIMELRGFSGRAFRG